LNNKLGRRRARSLSEKPTVTSEVAARDQPKSLFHYTTATGLIGIVGTQTLWATLANFLNDTAECQLLNRLLTPQIKKEFADIVPRLNKVGAFKPEFMETFNDDLLRTESEKVTGVLLSTIERVSPIYITSFCMHEAGSPESEHGLLSQWRGYGRGGFAIEFDEDELDALTKLENEKHSHQAIITRKVEYDDHDVVAKLDRFEGMGAAFLRVAFEDKVPKLAARADVAKILGDRHPQHFIRHFIETVPFLKNASFREENEYRIVALPTRLHSDAEKLDGRAHKRARFREGAGGTVVPYISLFGEPERHLPIKKVIVGPHRDQENQFNAARLLLGQHGIEAPVVKSDTTLRF
jgi:Protein of unknown function (DUF2971)